MVRDKSSSLIFIAFSILVGYLVRCLVQQQKTMTDSISEATLTTSKTASDQMASMSQHYEKMFVQTTSRVTGLAEVLILGRDSPSPNESLQTSSTDSESLDTPPPDWSDMPETARLAAEEELVVQSTEMPWQSSTQPDVLD